MRKILIFSMLLSVAALLAADDLRDSEAFKNAVDYTSEASQLQSDGQYDPSIVKAKDADSAMDEAFIDALHLLLKKKAVISRANAESQLNMLEKSGALADAKIKQTFQELKGNMAEGDALLQKAPEERSSDDKITEAYDAVIAEYNKAENGAKSAYEQYMAQKRAAAESAIKEAQAKYSALLGKGIIAKNDANDKKIAAFLQAAQKALGANDFNGVTSNVKSALDAMAAAEKAYGAESAKVKKQLDDAQKKFAQLKGSKIILGGSAEDKNITKLLSDAAQALNSGNLKGAQTAISNAVSQMNALEAAYKTASANAKKLIDAAQARQKKLNAEKLLPVNSADDEEVSRLLALALKAFGANDFKEAVANAEKAQQIMNNAEKAAAEQLKNVQELLDKAKMRHAEFVKLYGLADDDSSNMSIIEDLQNAEKAIAEGDWEKAVEFINSANAKMDYMEKMLRDAAEAAAEQEPAEEPEPEEPEPEVRVDEDGLPIDEYGRVMVLPKYYVVKRRVPITDCMWRIAEMYFVYGDRNEWRRIYDLNKDNFVQSGNPHLILPEQILEIPSFKGEERRGTYNPNKRYVPFDELVN